MSHQHDPFEADAAATLRAMRPTPAPERPNPWHRSEDCHGACHAAMTRQSAAPDAGLREAARLRRNVRFMGSDLPAFDGEWVAVPAADFDRLRAALSRQAEKETA
jgi:hypothetical protein